MKAFLEEYGLIVVAAIIIMVIVSIASPMGKMLTGESENTVTAMTDKLKNENVTTDPAEDEEEEVEIPEDLTTATIDGVTYTYYSSDSAWSVTGYTDEILVDTTIQSKIKGVSVMSIASKAFDSCKSLNSIVIPDGVTSIKYHAFSDCSNLTSIVIPDSVTSIGTQAFFSCSNLTSVTIPDSATSIEYDTFDGCKSLTSIIVDDNNSVYDSRENCNAIIETATNTLVRGCNTTVFPKSVTSIGSNAFNGCSNLTSITIPDSVTSIGIDAFKYCSNLTSVTISDNMTSIGSDAFRFCYKLKSVTYKGTTYTSKSALVSALRNNGVAVKNNDVFGSTALY